MSESDKKPHASLPYFEVSFVALEAALIVAYSQCVSFGRRGRYYFPGEDPTPPDEVGTLYSYMQHVQVMMFVGFGFLMKFLRNHSWTSVGVNFLITVVVIEMYMLANGFWESVFDDDWKMIELTIERLLCALFCSAAVLISFGGVLGKLNAFQLLAMAVIETWFYALNEQIFLKGFHAVDVGGSMPIHCFGAYFGLMLTWMVSPCETKNHPHNAPGYVSNSFAWIGTLFLWMYWPSFNGALAVGAAQLRAVINTELSLCSSTMLTYIGSSYFHKGKFSAEDALNATLAGGVIMGANADLVLKPYASLIIGSIAGIISVIGFNVLQPFLAKKIKLYDTCGIHNLHALPGVAGGLISIVMTGIMTDSNTGFYVDEIFPHRTADWQAFMQFLGLIVSIGLGLLGGLVTSLIVRLPFFNPPENLFQDSEFWVMHEGNDDNSKAQQHSRHQSHTGVTINADTEEQLAMKTTPTSPAAPITTENPNENP